MSYHEIEVKTEYLCRCRVSGCDFQSSHHDSPGEAESAAKEHINHEDGGFGYPNYNHVVEIIPFIKVGRQL